ncbi:hypothetical protein RSJ2_465 [Clostridium botulinum]|nr:hypothetical protein T257_1334 [Clostridium botulinum CDC_297]AJE11891.1 hypothetical protein T259_3927 [Clostridium botulinum CDC_1436]APR02046.1 hypothetical protein RSJ2_465 [Clostridium botulinum]APU59326.1 hypothetical protein NPD8_1278 [Clostridium botulinum]
MNEGCDRILIVVARWQVSKNKKMLTKIKKRATIIKH